MKQKLVTGWVEYYVYVDADSEEEAINKAKQSKDWCRTMNLPMENVKVEKPNED